MKKKSAYALFVLSSILMSAAAFSQEPANSSEGKKKLNTGGQIVQSAAAAAAIPGTYYIARAIPRAVRIEEKYSSNLIVHRYLNEMHKVEALRAESKELHSKFKALYNRTKEENGITHYFGHPYQTEMDQLERKAEALENEASHIEASLKRAYPALHAYYNKVVPGLTLLSAADAAIRLKKAWIDREPSSLIPGTQIAPQIAKATVATGSAVKSAAIATGSAVKGAAVATGSALSDAVQNAQYGSESTEQKSAE